MQRWVGVGDGVGDGVNMQAGRGQPVEEPVPRNWMKEGEGGEEDAVEGGLKFTNATAVVKAASSGAAADWIR